MIYSEMMIQDMSSLLSSQPNSSPVALLGISQRTINEMDAHGITLESFTEDSMMFVWNVGGNARQSDFLKSVVKKKVGHQCRISYEPQTGIPQYLILRRKYIS